MLPSEIYSQVKQLEIETNHILDSSFAGEYNSAFKGLGIEFEEVRPYFEGDDVRFIDWNVTAKMNQPFIKVFREERELSVFLLVDRSASMLFGSKQESKKELLLKLTALLALVSMKNNDQVGLVIFSDKIEKVIMPKKGRRHVLRIIEEVLAFEPEEQNTNLTCALEFIAKLAIKKSVLFILSDFMTTSFEKPLDIVYRKHDVVPIIIRDSLELSFLGNSFVRLEGLEDNNIQLINVRDSGFQTNMKELTTQDQKRLYHYFNSRGIDFIELQTGKPYIGSLAKYFKRRTQRRRY